MREQPEVVGAVRVGQDRADVALDARRRVEAGRQRLGERRRTMSTAETWPRSREQRPQQLRQPQREQRAPRDELAVVGPQQRADARVRERRRALLDDHPHHLLGRDAVGDRGRDERAGARADVHVELVDGPVDRQQIERPQGADLVDAAGEAAAAEHQRRLRSRRRRRLRPEPREAPPGRSAAAASSLTTCPSSADCTEPPVRGSLHERAAAPLPRDRVRPHFRLAGGYIRRCGRSLATAGAASLRPARRRRRPAPGGARHRRAAQAALTQALASRACARPALQRRVRRRPDHRPDAVLHTRQHPGCRRRSRSSTRPRPRCCASARTRTLTTSRARRPATHARTASAPERCTCAAAATRRSARPRSTSQLRHRRDGPAAGREPDPRPPASRARHGRMVADESMFDSLPGHARDRLPANDRGRGRAERRSPTTAAGRTADGTAFQPTRRCTPPSSSRRAARRRRQGAREPPVYAPAARPPARTMLASVHSPPIATLIAADQHAVGQLLRRDAAQGHRRPVRRRRHDRRRRRGRPSRDRQRASASTRASTTAPACLATTARPRLRSSRCSSRWPATPRSRLAGGRRRERHAATRCSAPTPRAAAAARPARCTTSPTWSATARRADGHTLAFAFLMNGIVIPTTRTPIQDRMAVALASYDG